MIILHFDFERRFLNKLRTFLAVCTININVIVRQVAGEILAVLETHII